MERTLAGPEPFENTHLGSEMSGKDDMDSFYKSDEFRMASMKVLPCSKRYVHDWTECPFAHPQEKARRRDPRNHSYTGIACPSMKREGTCAFGDWCPYAHNVFEYWLHPTRYRTQLCNDGLNCRRKICFFAHSLDELRVPACKPFVSPEALATAAAAAASETDARRRSGSVGPPSANLNLTPAQSARLSLESIRQSQDWGPVPMPANIPSSAPARVDSDHSSGGGQEMGDNVPFSPSVGGGVGAGVGIGAGQQQGQEGLTSRDERIVDTITQMLAKETLSPAQAASLLQQMLPAAALQTLQSRLDNTSGAPSASAFGDMLSAEQQQQQQQKQQQYASPSARPSMESTRSSFDTSRMSLEGTARMSSEFGGSGGTPRASLESLTGGGFYPSQQQQAGAGYAYAPPAPAYPQYWTTSVAAGGGAGGGGGVGGAQQQQQTTQQQHQLLSSVPEGMPMLNVPPSATNNPWATNTTSSSPTYVRRSPVSGFGSGVGVSNADDMPAAARLSQTFTRMSFDDQHNHLYDAAGSRGNGNGAGKADGAFASAFFSGSH